MGRESEEVGRGEGTDGKQVGAGWEAGDPSGLDREEMENKMRDKISKGVRRWQPRCGSPWPRAREGRAGCLSAGRPRDRRARRTRDSSRPGCPELCPHCRVPENCPTVSLVLSCCPQHCVPDSVQFRLVPTSRGCAESCPLSP